MRKIIYSIAFTIATIAVIFNTDYIYDAFNMHFKTYTVSMVKSNPRQFDRMKSFHITGMVKKGWGIPILIKVFPLEDKLTGAWVLIIPKTKVLPKASSTPSTFTVEIYGEQHLFDKDILILKER